MAGKISKTQGEELLRLVDELNFNEVFELLENYGFSDVVINTLKEEFMLGYAKADFTKRLKVYIGSITDNSLIETEYDIFFSFSSKNRAEAEPIVKLLRECELLVFFSDGDLQKHAGTLFIDKISEALHTSKHFLLYCTPEAMQAEWVKYEYKTFITTAHIPSGGKRHLFILQGSNFNTSLLTKENLFKGIQQSENITNILEILGKTLPKNDLAERKTHYKELYELFFENSPKIRDNQRKQLIIRQKELKLSEEQVIEIEDEVINDFEQEKIATEKEKIATEKTEKEGIIAELIRTLQLAAEKAEQEKLAVKKAKQERIAKGKAEKKKIAKEKAEQERIATEKIKEEELTWHNAKVDNFYHSYKNYLAIYPNGKYANKATLFAKQFVKQKEQERLAKEQNEENTIQNETITSPTNKTKSRNYAVIATIGFSLLLSGYGLNKWIEYNNEKEEERLAQIQINNSLQVAKAKGTIDGLFKKPAQKTSTNYKPITKFSEGLAVIFENQKFGFIDKQGNVKVKPKYDIVHHFYEGLAVVRLKDKYGYINTNGEEVIPPQYDYAFGFSEGLAKVILNGKVGFVNNKGNYVIPLMLHNEDKHYMFWIKVCDQELSMFLDNPKMYGSTQLSMLLDRLFYHKDNIFSKGIAQVETNDTTFYINKKGKCVKNCP
jgi:hypothetical protein